MRLFNNKRKEITSESIVVSVLKEKKTNDELVEEIHQTFFTEVDRLLEQAKVLKSTETTKQKLLDKSTKLLALGFQQTVEIIEAKVEFNRLRAIEKNNEANKEIIEAILYFSNKYPQYKFITEDSVKLICEKYNLIYGDVKFYQGNVPDANLKQMEEFSILDEDRCYCESYKSMFMNSDDKKISYDYYNSRLKSLRYDSNYTYTKSALLIAAPISDFNTTNMEIKDHQLKAKVKDPIILCPVFYKEKVYYLIVTAWGKEANDNLVINEKMN